MRQVYGCQASSTIVNGVGAYFVSDSANWRCS